MRKRETTSEERELFRSVFEEARPVRKVKAAGTPGAKPKVAAEKGQGGLDGRTSERLRRGLLEPDARLDLHGLTESTAHRALLLFLKSQQQRGAKLVLVVTGKGYRMASPDEPFDMERESRAHGVLKSAVPRWLREPQFAPLVADARDAHRKHGGEGALYIYLRKQRT